MAERKIILHVRCSVIYRPISHPLIVCLNCLHSIVSWFSIWIHWFLNMGMYCNNALTLRWIKSSVFWLVTLGYNPEDRRLCFNRGRSLRSRTQYSILLNMIHKFNNGAMILYKESAFFWHENQNINVKWLLHNKYFINMCLINKLKQNFVLQLIIQYAVNTLLNWCHISSRKFLVCGFL